MSNSPIIDSLHLVSQFCASCSTLTNAHTVDFIVGKLWELVPSDLADELLKLEENEIESLLDNYLESPIKSFYPHVYKFIEDTKSHSMEAFSACLPQLSSDYLSNNRISKFISKNTLMTPKKTHEVEAMASVIATLAKQHNIQAVLDFGTGKGYLSTHLALNHNLSVLGVDSKEGNCLAAKVRNDKLASQLNCKKSKINEFSISNPSLANERKCSNGVFIGQVLTVKDNMSFDAIIQRFIKEADYSPKSFQVLFSGLHACGNLQPCMIKHYLTTEQAKILCSVGCCYQHIQERFSPSPFDCDEDPDYGFPLSNFLIKIEYSIGYNARMLASQSMNRIVQEKSVRHKPLFYRALLQVILQEHCPDIKALRVGKLATKCSNFHEYVHKALKKLKLDHIKISEDVLNHYLLKYKEEEKKLHVFQFLRVLLAPCIETLLLLDRLAFLLEHENVQEAYAVRLFDPVISPRCYGVVAVKK